MPNLVHSFKFVAGRKKTTHYPLRPRCEASPLPAARFKVKRGFTLIELLVVITIIGILAGLTLATFGGTQARSRDSRRKTDLDALKKALELAKQDSTGSYYYPSCDSLDGPGGVGCVLNGTKTNPDITPSSGTPYIVNVPTDPKTNTGYIYIPAGSGCTTSPNTCSTYSVVGCLENARDTQKDEAQTGGTNNTTVCGTTGLKSYTVKPN